MLLFALLTTLISLSYTQSCLNHNGSPVQWWAILKVPPKIGHSGFGYYDSLYSQLQFQYISVHVDQSSALTHTLLQINSELLQSVAWNDEKPTGQTSTSLAHSKGLISYSSSSKKGFFISHSLPKYPAFINHKVNLTIASAQNYYGQDIFCISLSLSELNKLAKNLLITRPYIYQSNVRNSSETYYLAELAASKSNKVQQKFQISDFIPSETTHMKAIFKNGFQNSSIFQDGLTNLLKSNLVAETWGRPLQNKWCGRPYTVNNVQQVVVGIITWQQSDDHSKWVSAGNQYACFGDMNRMQSQWKRGGSFFCMQNSKLAGALKRAIVQQDKC